MSGLGLVDEPLAVEVHHHSRGGEKFEERERTETFPTQTVGAQHVAIEGLHANQHAAGVFRQPHAVAMAGFRRADVEVFRMRRNEAPQHVLVAFEAAVGEHDRLGAV